MSRAEDETQRFLGHAYDLVTEHLTQKTSPDDWFDDDEETEAMFIDDWIAEAQKTIGVDPASQDSGITATEEKEIFQATIRPIAKSYVVGMIKGLLTESHHDPVFPEERLDTLWDDKYSSGEFIDRLGISSDQGKIVLETTKKALLEDLLEDPVTVSMDQRRYTITKKNQTIYVSRHD